MHNESLDKRLFEIHMLINPALHPDQLDPDRIELAEEHLDGLRNDLAGEIEPHDPERCRKDILAALRRAIPTERMAEIIASLPPEGQVKIVKTYFMSPPVTRTVKIRIKKR